MIAGLLAPDRRAFFVRGIIVVGLSAGILLSPSLWGSVRDYPLAPIVPFAVLPDIPSAWVVPTLLILLLLAAIPRRWTPVPFLVAITLLVLADYTRLQPWVYQLSLMLAAFSFARDPLRVCGIILALSYIWSGIHKLNASYATQVFPWMLLPLGGYGIDIPSPSLLAPWGYISAIVETLLGAGLLYHRTRRASVTGIVLMHAGIFLSLGPLGHNWNSVVWPWNGALALLTLAIFWYEGPLLHTVWRPQGMYAMLVSLLVGLLPAFHLIGLWDAYLSFSLYSGNTTYAAITAEGEVIERLPEQAKHVMQGQMQPDRLVPLLDWSMRELNVPPYPETRVFRRLFLSLCDSLGDPPGLQIFINPYQPLLGTFAMGKEEDCATIRQN